MKKTLRILTVVIAVALLVLFSVMVYRTLRLPSRQVRVEPAPDVTVDSGALAEHLAQALRFQTVSYQEAAQFKSEEFEKLRQFLEQTYPDVHAKLNREVVAGYSLLYTWPGSDATLKPILLMGHLDVVPIEPGTEGAWTYPPFEGRLADGYVWGRGALDDKAAVIGLLEACEMLLKEGYQPRRTIYLAFGHDEELGGPHGAPAVAELLRSRNVNADYVLDEGGAITDGMMKGVARPLAVVGIAEKGFISVELTTKGTGGHSSAPPPQTAIGILSAAIAQLEAHPLPGAIKGVTAQMFDYAGPEFSFLPRMSIANLWLTRPFVTRQLAAAPTTNAMLRTTTAATVFEGGVKDNVLPSTARAVVNFRILPGDSAASVLDHVRQTINDPRVKIEPLKGMAMSEPSNVSSTEAAGFKEIERTIRQLFPNVAVAPYLVIGATDSRHYAKVSQNIYRFAPTWMRPGDFERLHGTNERIGVENFAHTVKFYRQLIRNSDQ